ncbi:SpoIIE family protein phosphatase [Streptomyces sp. NPDC052016]|uniref:SpoIIE family protein phosphatase n=1 Tax=Streptomyces sp. NPDC052016 TaxID=3365680 RepID=UPI0037CD0457
MQGWEPGPSVSRAPSYALPLGLGAHGAEPAETFRTDFLPGDQLLLYTDGITEARDAKGRFHPLAERAHLLKEGDPEAALEMPASGPASARQRPAARRCGPADAPLPLTLAGSANGVRRRTGLGRLRAADGPRPIQRRVRPCASQPLPQDGTRGSTAASKAPTPSHAKTASALVTGTARPSRHHGSVGCPAGHPGRIPHITQFMDDNERNGPKPSAGAGGFLDRRPSAGRRRRRPVIARLDRLRDIRSMEQPRSVLQPQQRPCEEGR